MVNTNTLKPLTLILLFTCLATCIASSQNQPGQSAQTDSVEYRPVPKRGEIDTSAMIRGIVGWHEVMGGYAYTLMGSTYFHDGQEYWVQSNVHTFSAEYRYCVLRYITVGGRLTFGSFEYQTDGLVSLDQASNNIRTAVSALVHFRTSKYRRNDSFIFYLGLTLTHLSMQRATVLSRSPYSQPWETTTHIEQFPDASHIFTSINLGYGYETGAIIGKTGRIRIFFDQLFKISRDDDTGVGHLSTLPTIGLGFSW